MNMGFNWNNKKIKTTINTPDRGQVIVEMPASQIVKEPNRHRMESIISALCVTVSELIEINESQAKRIVQLQETIRGKKNDIENPALGGDLGGDHIQNSVQ
jgi:hypothetical protein